MAASLGLLWKATQAPEPAHGFCYHHHLLSLLPHAVSVSQGQELWCQLPPSYLPWLCLNPVTDAFLKVAQLFQQLPALPQEPRARREVGAQAGGVRRSGPLLSVLKLRASFSAEVQKVG